MKVLRIDLTFSTLSTSECQSEYNINPLTDIHELMHCAIKQQRVLNLRQQLFAFTLLTETWTSDMPYHSPIIPIDTIHPHNMAEGTGFEPVCGSSPRIAFQASRLSLSRNLPVSCWYRNRYRMLPCTHGTWVTWRKREVLTPNVYFNVPSLSRRVRRPHRFLFHITWCSHRVPPPGLLIENQVIYY